MAKAGYLRAFMLFLGVAAVASIPAAEAQLMKQNMSATLVDRLMLYALIGTILSAFATFIYWWHRGSRRGLITALVIIAVFAVFGWRGASS